MSARVKGARSSYGEGVGYGALGFVAVAAVGLVSSFAVARLYGVDVIGQFALAMAPTTSVWFLSSAREQAALVRALSRSEPRDPRVTGLFTAVMTFSFGLTVVVAIPSMVATYFLFNGPVHQPDVFMPALVSMAGYVVLTNTCWNVDMVLSAFRAGRLLFWLRLHQIAVYAIVAIALSAVDDSVWGLVIATVMSWGTALVHRGLTLHGYMRLRVPRAEIRAGFKTLPELLRFGVRIVPGAIADGISQEVSVWVLGIVAPVAAVGAYSRAWMLSRRVIELNYRITEMLFPTLVEHHHEGDRHAFDRTLVDTLRLASCGLLLPAAAGGGAAVGIMALFGPGFGRAAPALAIVLLVPALSLLSQCQVHALIAIGRPLTTSKVSLCRMVVTVATCIFLAQAYGTTGAAISVVAGYVVDLAIRFAIATRIMHTPLRRFWPIHTMMALAGAYGAGFLAARGVDHVIGGVVGTFLALAAGTVAYVGAFVALGGLLPRDRVTARRVWTRVRHRGDRPEPAVADMPEAPPASVPAEPSRPEAYKQ